MLRWVARLVAVLALTMLAFGWARIARDFDLAAAVAFGLLTAVLLFAIFRLFAPGGLAALEFDDDDEADDAMRPAAWVKPTFVARPARPSRDARTWRSTATASPATASAPADSEPPPVSSAPRPARAAAAAAEDRHIARVERAGSLWSSGTRPAPAVDVNAATVDELAALPGVGSEWAQRIADDRIAHGPFRDLEDLRRVEGLDPTLPGGLAGRART